MMTETPAPQVGGARSKLFSVARILACVVGVSLGTAVLVFVLPALHLGSREDAFRKIRPEMSVQEVVALMGEGGQWFDCPAGAGDHWDDKWDGKAPSRSWIQLPIQKRLRYQAKAFPAPVRWEITFDSRGRVVGKWGHD